MNTKTFLECFKILKKNFALWNAPVVSFMAEQKETPFRILVSTILSARTKDDVTKEASKRLFLKIQTPNDLLLLDEKEISKIIYPVGFYKIKAKHLKENAKMLIDKFNGKVPSNLTNLLSLSGVGRKTANLVLSLVFHKPAICVDTHVHRIPNRIGFISTKTPFETEQILMELIDKKYWRDINTILVAFGQTICSPTSPKCFNCPIENKCEYLEKNN